MKLFVNILSGLVQNRRGGGSRPFYGCKSVLKKSKYKPHQGARERARRKRQGLA